MPVKPAKKQTPYETLGIDPKADAPTIRRAYRKKAKELHPDRGGSPEAFEEAARAYRLLTDERRRRLFDENGDDSEPPPDDSLTKRMEVIWPLLGSLIGQCQASGQDPTKIDLLAKVREQIEEKIRLAEKTKYELGKTIATVEKVKARMKVKEDKPDMLGAALGGDIQRMEAAIARAQADIDNLKECVTFLGDYDYMFDNPFNGAYGFEPRKTPWLITSTGIQ
jgi:hypothetical protein